jgi:hypothetical protein
MHLIQLLLPLYDNDGAQLSNALFMQVRDELVGRFGGITAYTRAPASGLWQESESATVRDDLVIYEVMAEAVDAGWWQDYRRQLETRFRQEKLVVRAHQIRML